MKEDFQMVGAKRENLQEAVFVDEDCVDSRSDADDLKAVSLFCCHLSADRGIY